MVKNIIKNKMKLIGAVILGICLTFSISTITLANSNNALVVGTEIQNSDKERFLLDKQSQIDKYVFEEHTKDIEQKGFKVTNTGQANGYVEVGITPFTNENAEYIYSLFGKEFVKVVEGQQAELMTTSVSTTSTQVKGENKASYANLLVYVVILAAAAGVITLVVQKQRIKE